MYTSQADVSLQATGTDYYLCMCPRTSNAETTYISCCSAYAYTVPVATDVIYDRRPQMINVPKAVCKVVSVYVLVRLCAIICTPSNMGLRHQYFIARTVLVRNGNVDEAVRLLNR